MDFFQIIKGIKIRRLQYVKFIVKHYYILKIHNHCIESIFNL